MTLRYHEIAEANHRILNPYTDEKLMTLGEICRLKPSLRLLDLACGKGELLCRWAERYGVHGLGVDISEVFLGVDDRSEGVGPLLQGASAPTLDLVGPMADVPEELTRLTLRVSPWLWFSQATPI